jgi:hypothetical protein
MSKDRFFCLFVNLVLWPIPSSSLLNILGWTSVSIYFTIVLLVTILSLWHSISKIFIESMQFLFFFFHSKGKPYILFSWSIVMIVMLLADGIVTVLSLREYQKQV